MGLFGPNWTWEEIQRKESIMGDIRRENDRVLAEQRAENNRIMKETNPKPLFLIDRFRSEKTIKYHTNIRAQIASGKYLKALFTWNKGSDYAWIFKWLCIIFILFSIAGIAFMPMDFLKYVFPYMLLIIFLYLFIKTLKYIPFLVMTSSKLNKNNCYKGILEKVKQQNLTDIKYIAINKEKVRVINKENIKKDFYYSEYNYPELNIKRQPIFLGKLLKDLNINSKFKIGISKIKKEIDIFTIDELKENGLGIYDYGECIIAENKSISKQIKSKRSNNKVGNSW